MPRRRDHGFRTPTFAHAHALDELISSYCVDRLVALCRRLDRRVKWLKAQNLALKARLAAADGENASLREAISAAVDEFKTETITAYEKMSEGT